MIQISAPVLIAFLTIAFACIVPPSSWFMVAVVLLVCVEGGLVVNPFSAGRPSRNRGKSYTNLLLESL